MSKYIIQYIPKGGVVFGKNVYHVRCSSQIHEYVQIGLYIIYTYPRCSMYGILPNHKFKPNVGKYSVHGAFG